MSKITLSSKEIIDLIGKYGSQDHPALKALDGRSANISLYADGDKCWAEIKPHKDTNPNEQ